MLFTYPHKLFCTPYGLCAPLFKNHRLHVPVLSCQRSVVRLGEGEAVSLSKNTLGQILQLKGWLLRE